MYDFDKLDPTTKPFVLDQDNAVEWLKHQASLLFDESIADEHNGYGVGIACDTASGIFEELVCMAQTILDNNWQYVLFGEHMMKESHIFVEECITLPTPYVEDTLRFAENTLNELEEINNKAYKNDKEGNIGEYKLNIKEEECISKSCEALEQLIDILKRR